MDALVQVFTHSLDPNPNARKAAELELKKVESQDGMLSSVFQVVASPQVDLAVRQASAIYFKNRVRRKIGTLLPFVVHPHKRLFPSRTGIHQVDHLANACRRTNTDSSTRRQRTRYYCTM